MFVPHNAIRSCTLRPKRGPLPRSASDGGGSLGWSVAVRLGGGRVSRSGRRPGRPGSDVRVLCGLGRGATTSCRCRVRGASALPSCATHSSSGSNSTAASTARLPTGSHNRVHLLPRSSRCAVACLPWSEAFQGSRSGVWYAWAAATIRSPPEPAPKASCMTPPRRSKRHGATAPDVTYGRFG